jgi:hypothetical protein
MIRLGSASKFWGPTWRRITGKDCPLQDLKPPGRNSPFERGGAGKGGRALPSAGRRARGRRSPSGPSLEKKGEGELGGEGKQSREKQKKQGGRGRTHIVGSASLGWQKRAGGHVGQGRRASGRRSHRLCPATRRTHFEDPHPNLESSAVRLCARGPTQRTPDLPDPLPSPGTRPTEGGQLTWSRWHCNSPRRQQTTEPAWPLPCEDTFKSPALFPLAELNAHT